MRRSGVASVLLSLLVAAESQAVCPQPPPKVCSTFFSSDVVLSGTVAAVEEVPDGDGFIEGWRYRISVAEVFKGRPRKDVFVHTPNDSGRLLLEVGNLYVLFAHAQGHQLEVFSDCGTVSQADHAADTVQAIRRLSRARDSIIEGQVAKNVPGPGVSGVRVEVSGPGATRRLVTDEHGWFRTSVPPGRYVVRIDSRLAAPFDLSTDSPERLVLQAGQCAQLQFVAR